VEKVQQFFGSGESDDWGKPPGGSGKPNPLETENLMAHIHSRVVPENPWILRE
jgi:hypothetical protein